MELRPGYKQTEVGVIPEEWETPTIAEVSRNILDYRGRTPRKLGMDWGGGDIPALSARNVKMGYIDFEEECYFGSEALYERWMTNGDVTKGDIVVTMEAPLGNVAQIPDGRKYILSQRTVLLHLNPDRSDSQFLFQVMRSQRFQSILLENATGSTAKGIQRRKFEKLKVVCPPIPEQCSIAGALGDVDALLGALTQLIAKKRDLKQAAMQQLLTGQTRLPGFSGKWEVKQLGEVGSFSKGKGIRKDEVISEGLPCIRYGEIYTHHNDYVREFFSFIPAEVARQSQRLQKGDLLFAGSGETAEEIGKCVAFLGDTEAYAGGDIVIFTPRGHNSMYLGYLMNHASIVEQKARMGQGNAVVHVSARNLAQLNVRLSQEAEQTAIATVLSDMDAEISALEARLEKTRALKQGMLQELLTGRTRLV